MNTPTWIGPYEIQEFVENYFTQMKANVSDVITVDDESRVGLISQIHAHFQRENPLPLICANGKKTYAITGITSGDERILVMDPHYQENVSSADFSSFFEGNYEQRSSEEDKRKHEMLENAIRWETAENFFTSEPFWSVLFCI